MGVPFILFWAILYIAREDMGIKGISACIVIWAVLLAACLYLSISPYVFVGVQALFDAILVIVVFGGDIKIR